MLGLLGRVIRSSPCPGARTSELRGTTSEALPRLGGLLTPRLILDTQQVSQLRFFLFNFFVYFWAKAAHAELVSV